MHIYIYIISPPQNKAILTNIPRCFPTPSRAPKIPKRQRLPRLGLQPPVPDLHEEIQGAAPGGGQGADGRAHSHDVGIAALQRWEKGEEVQPIC